eukprot:TRINITY_DN2204_c0_g1_i4.p1 TRINITY_DN2204_c0_g1~~TRINITY_DN2204_c0_g1_i4.p1  ORF type:complete len:352 (+),score=51.78 TRINITY_DN2204_c0_g1_i4:136-1056(+)
MSQLSHSQIVYQTSDGNSVDSTGNGNANAGNFAAFSGIQTVNNFVLKRTATNNNALSEDGKARSGNVAQFRGGNVGLISGSQFTVESNADENEATSETGDAVSGEQNIFNKVLQDSTVQITGTSTNNNATITDTDANRQSSAISGAQNTAKEVTGGSVFKIDNTATDNTATNLMGGKAVSGVLNAAKTTANSTIEFVSSAENNVATNQDGEAVAGAQNNLFEGNNINLVVDSSTRNNSAVSEGGDAVAGVQNNVGTISNGSNFTSSGTATDNYALSTGLSRRYVAVAAWHHGSVLHKALLGIGQRR